MVHANTLGSRALLPSTVVAARYGVTRRTLARWMTDKSMEFPEPTTINARHYFDSDDLTQWERSRATARPWRRPSRSTLNHTARRGAMPPPVI